MNQCRPVQLIPALRLCMLLIQILAAPAFAADMIAGAAGKTGEFQVKLTHRTALSSKEEITKRIPARGAALTDYDISTENFDVYVPAEAGADGTYGLMVALNFREFGKPPKAWEQVLDKHHIIWIGAENTGDGTPYSKRVGLMLDEVFNAEGTWKIDPNRVFSFISSEEVPACGAPLYFPEVFVGSVDCHLMQWFHNIANGTFKFQPAWQYGKLPRLKPPYLDLAKSRRYYIIDRLEDFHEGGNNPNTDVMKDGFLKDGFKNVTLGAAETHMTTKYADCAAVWFEPAVVYVDVPPEKPAIAMADAPAAASAADAQTPGPQERAGGRGRGRRGRDAAATAPPPTQTDAPPAKVDATPPPPPVPDDPAAKAAKALSLAKSYISAERFETARTRLQQIIQTYPDTPSAKEAKSLLDEIKGK